MNKSNGVNHFLTSASLFKNSQKNRFVSAYLTHQTYFAQDQPPANPTNIFNPTKSKKDYSSFPQKDREEGDINVNRNDALQATVKRDIGQQVVAKLIEYGDKNIAQSKIQQENEVMPIEQKDIKKKQDNITNDPQVPLDQSLSKSSAKKIKSSNTKIVLNYPNMPVEPQKAEIFPPEAIKPVEQVYNSKHSRQSYNIRIEDLDSHLQGSGKDSPKVAQDSNNPYIPSSLKKQSVKLNIYKTDNGEVALKRIQSNSFQPFSALSESPKQEGIITSSLIAKNKRPSGENQNNYIQNIKKDISGFLINVKSKLKGSYLSLEEIENQYDVLIDKNLQIECDRLKKLLYRMIEEEINDFKQYEKRQFCKNKFYFMSDLFQIKCNIDLRLEEIEQYELQLKDQYRWKSNVNNFIGVDYNQNIDFILKKTDQMQKDLLANVSAALHEEIRGVSDEANRSIMASIRENFADIYDNKLRRKRIPTLKQT